MEIHERIKFRRKEIGLSADDVANALGVSRATIYRYESADIDKLPTTVLEPLSKVLHCSIAYLMGWEEKDSCQIKHELVLSSLEENIIIEYRKADSLDQAMVLRILKLSEKGENTKMA